VILIGSRRPEDGDGVADELLDRPSSERDLRGHRIVETIEEITCVLRVE